MGVLVCVGAKISHDNERFEFSDGDEPRAKRNHYQTLARLNERGGLSWSEAAAILEDREWRKMPDAEAEALVRAIIGSRPTLTKKEPT